jgi:hypothetical protein
VRWTVWLWFWNLWWLLVLVLVDVAWGWGVEAINGRLKRNERRVGEK